MSEDQITSPCTPEVFIVFQEMAIPGLDWDRSLPEPLLSEGVFFSRAAAEERTAELSASNYAERLAVYEKQRLAHEHMIYIAVRDLYEKAIIEHRILVNAGVRTDTDKPVHPRTTLGEFPDAETYLSQSHNGIQAEKRFFTQGVTAHIAQEASTS